MPRNKHWKLASAAALTALVLLLLPAAAQACKGADDSPSQLTVREARGAVICLMNKVRRSHGVRGLHHERRLQRAAQRHSQAMDARNFFSHSSPNGASPLTRIKRTGYLGGARSWAVGENIRWGADQDGTPRVAVRRWLQSASHRRAMLSSRYKHVGIGVDHGSPAGGDADAAIYTADFGFRR